MTLYIGLPRSKQHKANKRFLDRMMKGNWMGRCFWCKCDVFRALRGDDTFHNCATVDHLYSKLDIRRFIAGEREKYMRVSCKKCNNDRDVAFRKSIFTYPNETVNIIDFIK